MAAGRPADGLVRGWSDRAGPATAALDGARGNRRGDRDDDRVGSASHPGPGGGGD
jgi:hypothetical protein